MEIAGVNAFVTGAASGIGKVLRTPEARFANLPDYPFAPNFLMDLRNVILVCQDWGLLIGLRIAAQNA